MKIGVGHQQFAIVLDQHLFKNLDQFGEERIRKVGDNDPVDITLSALEMNSAGVGDKFQIVDDLLDAAGSFFCNQRRSVDNPGNGGTGHPCQLGNFAHASYGHSRPLKKTPLQLYRALQRYMAQFQRLVCAQISCRFHLNPRQ